MSSTHPDPTRRAVAFADARELLWDRLRLVVIDTETCQATDGDHIVAVGVVTCRNHRTYESWSGMVDPGVPIDPHTIRIHGITNEHVTGEPAFADYVPRLLDQLTPTDDEERVVIAGHNVGFDVSRLHLELHRAGHQLPDLPLLDTQTLAAHVGIDVDRYALPNVLAALGLVNPAHHDAMADAFSTAQAAIALLDRAVDQGASDLLALLEAASPGKVRPSDIRTAKTTGDPTKPLAGRRDGIPVLAVPASHTSAHTSLLPASPNDDQLDAWAVSIEDCVTLRCPLLADDVAATDADPDVLRPPLEDALGRALDADDAAGAATVLAALAPLLADLTPKATAQRWWDRWADRIATVGRCRDDDRCPACTEERPCPVDVWHHQLAPAALGPAHHAKSFLRTSGTDEGGGVIATWRSKNRHRLADHVAWLTWLYWRDQDQPSKAEQVARLAWEGGSRDPRLVSVYAGLVGAPRTPSALKRAIDICDTALAGRNGDTDDGWQQVIARRQQLASHLKGHRPRLRVGPDGAPVAIRRHHPTDPRRRPRRRFSAG